MLIGRVIIDTDCPAWVRQQLVSRSLLLTQAYCCMASKARCGTIDSQVKMSHICLCPAVISLSKLITKLLNVDHEQFIVMLLCGYQTD